MNGRTQTLTAWAAECGISLPSLSSRLSAGWTPEEAVTTPKVGKTGPPRGVPKSYRNTAQNRPETLPGETALPHSDDSAILDKANDLLSFPLFVDDAPVAQLDRASVYGTEVSQVDTTASQDTTR